MGTLEFLRENVGKFFMYGGERCRLVGAEKDAGRYYMFEGQRVRSLKEIPLW